ncbi:MAG: metal-sensitive transcriptional regulator [Candidatus Aminicenantaceae bacterium]
MKEQTTTHLDEVVPLKRIEGQIRGIQKMIEEKRYCIDILTQLSSVIGAIKRVEEDILHRHLRGCVRDSFLRSNNEDKERKINEVIDVLQKFRKY